MGVDEQIRGANDNKVGRASLTLVALAAAWASVMIPDLGRVWGVPFVV